MDVGRSSTCFPLHTSRAIPSRTHRATLVWGLCALLAHSLNEKCGHMGLWNCLLRLWWTIHVIQKWIVPNSPKQPQENLPGAQHWLHLAQSLQYFLQAPSCCCHAAFLSLKCSCCLSLCLILSEIQKLGSASTGCCDKLCLQHLARGDPGPLYYCCDLTAFIRCSVLEALEWNILILKK